MRRYTIVVIAGIGLALPAMPARFATADSPYLYGIHWWGYTQGQSIDTTPATLLDCPAYGGWDLETVLTNSASWWSSSFFLPLYQDLVQNKNMSMITRFDYDWGQTVPAPTNPNYAQWPATCRSNVNNLRNTCRFYIIGNEPNIVGEGNGWPDGQITPAGYAQIYRNVRAYIHANALPSPLGPYVILVAPPSPGGVIAGVRWMDGDQWLSQVIDNIPPAEIDGFAIHAYGGDVSSFRASFAATLTMIDGKGLQSRPVFMTEWNRYATPGSATEEAAAASFLRNAFAAVNDWNQTPGKHNIVAMTWFVYDADQQAAGLWNGHSIEYWRGDGNPLGTAGDLYTAFQQTVDLRYPAGAWGVPVRPPTANFTAAPMTGRAPLAVHFTDYSDGTITSRTWTFGDGATSGDEDPTHTYTTRGLYTVSLTVTNDQGSDTETKPDLIRVYAAPDFNLDDDVDIEDFSFFQICFNGPNRPYPLAECDITDFDQDGDTDLADFATFLTCYNGPGRLPACSQ